MTRPAFITALALGLASVAFVARAAVPPADPFLWLEDVHGTRATAWVAAENAKTRAALTRDPRFATLRAESLALRTAKDRLPSPEIVNGSVYDFRQDAAHPRGYWRTTSLAGFSSATPAWKTILDLDAVAGIENKNWVWRGADCDSTSETRCLISLSEGGEDAVTIREFDLLTDSFVTGGFTFPHGKQDVAWIDDDTLLVAREWKPGELTTSGYAYVVDRVKRGDPPGTGVEVYRGTTADVGVSPAALQDASGRRAVFVRRDLTTFESETQLVTPGGVVPVPFPKKSALQGLLRGRLLLSIDEPWTIAGTTFAAGSLLSMDLSALEADPAHPVPTLVFAPGPRQTFDSVTTTADHAVVISLDDVKGRASVFTPADGGMWTSRPLPLPDDSTVAVLSADERGSTALLSVTSFLTPTSFWSADTSGDGLRKIVSAPARFDATRDVTEQREAVSKDGTRVPYFIVHRRDFNYDGTAPTILTAYGGFAISNLPYYSGVRGKLWLARGGAVVVANIRGGGEFGPAWHEAGLKTHRQRIYDDFSAVARDLIARKVTSPRHLGIQGGSNGGLLMGVEFTQHPELYGAVDIQIPLLDMLRFEKIAAGSSWTGEYGSVSVPSERAFLAKISPYANLHPGVRYPEPFIWTTTKDDRVGPQHARKFAAALAALHDPYLFFEQTEGGHGQGVNAKEDADLDALEYTYFAEKLM